MSELEDLRGEIDGIDRQLVELFERRMDVTARVGRYKAARGLPVLDPAREREVLAKKAASVRDPALRTDVTLLYETIMGLSRRQQHALAGTDAADPGFARYAAALENEREPVREPRVVYQGEPGAYSEMAALDFFGAGTACAGLAQFEDVFLALRDGRADYGVVPIENNTTGAIRQIYDLLSRYDFYMVGETAVRVAHCLMAPEGATLNTITHVYSHEQGLFQSEQFLNRHPAWHRVPSPDTAGSARYVSETGDITKAAICSRRAAELYGLKILAEDVNYNGENTTRFVVISPKMERRGRCDKVSTVFTLPHQAGALHTVLTIFAVHGLNILRLESRPMPGRSWEYMFFLEFAGDLRGEGMDGVVHELSQLTADFRVFGNFPSNLSGGELG